MAGRRRARAHSKRRFRRKGQGTQAAETTYVSVKWNIAMPEENRIDDVEKVLAEQHAVDERKTKLIADLLKQREAAIKDFDDKLAKLGYQASDDKPKRSHHSKAGTRAAGQAAKEKTKT